MSEPGGDVPPFPVETEIYILPSGEIIVADLPAELAVMLAAGVASVSDDEDEGGATP